MDRVQFDKGERISVTVTREMIEAAKRNTRRTARWNREKKRWEVTIATASGYGAITVVAATPEEG